MSWRYRLLAAWWALRGVPRKVRDVLNDDEFDYWTPERFDAAWERAEEWKWAELTAPNWPCLDVQTGSFQNVQLENCTFTPVDG